MTLRLIVIGLVVINIFLWGWAALQPESGAPSVVAVSRSADAPDVPSITLAREASISLPGGSQVSRQCYSIGPLSSRSALQSMQDRLSSSVLEINSHETSLVVEQGYWVYLEPFGSYAQASEAVEQLVANGVRDYFIMPDGPHANAVSVGLYEQRSQAQSRIEDIESLGLGWPVVMEMQRKDEPRFWLDFELRPETAVDVEALLAEQEGAQILEVPCPENEASFPPT